MKNLLLFCIIIISFSWSIGLQGLVIPQNGHILSTAGTGIAGDIHPALNPAMNISSHSYIQFSHNNWLGDVSGSHTLYRWGKGIPKQLSIQTWNAEEILQYGNKPEDSPLGTFGVHYVSAAYSMSHNFNTPYRFGLRIQSNYSHLFTESLAGITLDAGTIIPIGSSFTLGAVIRNLGYEYTNNLQADLPVEGGIGAALKLSLVQASILTDLIYNTINGKEIRGGLTTQFKWLNFNAGISFSEKDKEKNTQSMGFSFNYRRWKINYSINLHENSAILGTPQFLDVRRYL